MIRDIEWRKLIRWTTDVAACMVKAKSKALPKQAVQAFRLGSQGSQISEGNMSLKNPVTPPGIDLRTVRLVAQRLDHYATPDP